MNKGLAISKGKWIYFLGTDDELYSNEILKEISLILTKTAFNIIYGNLLNNGDTGGLAII